MLWPRRGRVGWHYSLSATDSRNNMWVITQRKIFYAISGVIVLASLASLIVWGLHPGIDFTGGTLVDVSYPSGRPSQPVVTAALSGIDPAVSVRPSGENDYIVRMKPLSQDEHTAVT